MIFLNNKKKYIAILIIIFIVALIVIYFILLPSKKDDIQLSQESQKEDKAQTSAHYYPLSEDRFSGNNEVGSIKQNRESNSENLDSDGDGITDQEEKILGLNPHNTDTDNDGIFDIDEINITKTDPLNPDTDGDGYLDGDEVKAGYNPKGDGAL